MRNLNLAFLVLITLALVQGCISAADESLQRYRGNYIRGHEVNSFCPDLSSRCYWLAAATPAPVRQELRRLAQVEQIPYRAVCVVLAGVVNVDTLRDGFAADYDGLIDVHKVYGRCSDTQVVVDADLRHHRWQIASVNGVNNVPARWPDLPELDFGTQMATGIFVEGNDGCGSFTASARLQDDNLVFKDVRRGTRVCSAGAAAFDTSSDLQVAMVGQAGGGLSGLDQIRLRLSSHGQQLEFQLNDWR
jgi:heat shock protein HslJ